MALTKKNLEEILTDEPLSEFINLVDYAQDPKDNGIFYCKNGYRGFAYILEANAFASLSEHKGLVTLYDSELPVDSVIQIVNLPSRNLNHFFDFYINSRNNASSIKEPEKIKLSNIRRLDWLKKSVHKGLINDKFEFYPKNWITLAIFMIPLKNKKAEIKDETIISYKNKAFSKLYAFNPQEAHVNDVMRVLNEILEPHKKEWNINWDRETPIDSQVISSSTKYFDNDDGTFLIYDVKEKKKPYYVSVLTTRSYPGSLNVGITQNLFLENFNDKTDEPYIKCPMVATITVVVEDKTKEKNLLQAKSKNNQWQVKLLGDGLKFFPKMVEIDRESQQLDYLITNHNETIFKMQFSVIVLSDKKSKLEEQVSIIESNFSNKSWTLQVESEMAIPVFLYSLPFQFDLRYKDMSKRFKTSLRSNNAAATPLLNDTKGIYTTTPLCLHFGRTGQIQFFDNFNKDGNANMVVAAGSRSGKTFWTLEYVMSSLSAGRMVRVIEAGRNFEALAQELGGKFLSFQEDEHVCLNFFTDAKTINSGKELHPEEVTTIIPLIGLMIGRKLIASSDDEFDPDSQSDNAIISSYIETAVKNAYKSELRQTGLSDVKKQLNAIFETNKKERDYTDERLRDLMTALEPYADVGGVYYNYFNGPRNVYFSDNPFVVFELNDLKNKDEKLMFVVLMALIKIVANEFYGEEFEDILKALICDEAWMILDNPFIANFLIRVWRTIAKHKGCGISISQDINLYFKNKDMEAIYDNSTYKIFLKQNPEQLERLSTENKISSDKFFLSKLKSLQSQAGFFSEMLVKVENSFFISRIILDRFSFYLYSTPDKVPYFNEIRKKFNLQKNDTAFMFAYIDDNPGTSFEEAYDELMYAKGLKKREKLSIDEPLGNEIVEDIPLEIFENNNNVKIKFIDKIKDVFIKLTKRAS